MTEQAKVPAIRFAGFTDPWEQRKFSDIVDVCSGKDYKHLEEGPIPVYGTGGFMTSVDEALSYDRDAVGIGRKGTIDKPYLLKAPFWTVDTLFYAIPKSDMDLEFVHCSFLNVDWKSKDESTGLPSLSKEAINETIALVPSFNEQSRLGEFFSDLDSLITLHQRKYDKLVVFKKSMLEKMFPKDGESVPEIRFAGFTDPWEQRKFSELASLRRGLTYSPADIRPYGQGIRVLRSSNIDEDEFTLSNEDVFVDETVVGIELVQEGEILITAANGSPRLVGKRAIINGLTGKTVHGGFMLCAHAEQPDYVAALMGSRWYQHFLATGVAGGNGSIGNLDKAALEDEFAFVPSIEEQELIGVLFSRLDDLITLHQRKLELLRNIKKSLLDKMFV